MSMNYYMNIIVNSLIIKKNKMYKHFIFLYYFELFNILSKKKWSLAAPSGGQIKSITQVYEYYINPYKIRLFLIFIFNYIMTVFNTLGT